MSSSSSIPLLLLGILLGVSAEDGSEYYAATFADTLNNAIEFRNMEFIRRSFSDSFVFEGCFRNYTKEDVIGMLDYMPPGIGFSLHFERSQFISPKAKTEFISTVRGGGYYILADFIIDVDISTGVWFLVSGHNVLCRKSQTDSAEEIARFFVELVKNEAHYDRNNTQLAKRFSDEFMFHGCVSDYTKGKAIEALSKSELTLNFKSARFVNGEDIEISEEIVRYGVSYESQFMLQRENREYVLTWGWITNCPARRYLDDGSEHIAKAFIAESERAFESRDAGRRGALLSDGFDGYRLFFRDY